ncbi:hypothetical protein [Paraclostridium sordellii]|uniref:hypothetical protein n=1 Tax=Paraclostridium sordellii TaxID=1505 RepID=UPI0013E0730D|nr:hypothetical protein [Paeniclostridium sordellii]
MRKSIEQYLNYMKEEYIKNGYNNSGAIIPKKEKDRLIINELIDMGIVVKRKCIIESYMLSKDVRMELIKEFGLNKKWEVNANSFHIKSKELRGELYLIYGNELI